MRRVSLFLLLALLGCPEEAPTTLDAAKVDALAAAFARALVACEERGALEALVEPDGGRDLALTEGSLRAYLRALNASPHVRKDPAALEACLVFLEEDAVCEGLEAEEGACDRVFQGTLAGGARCALDEECGSAVCVMGPSSRCGACAADETAGEGEFCGQRLCAEGLACNYGGDAPVCARLRAEGERCIDDDDGLPRFFACDDGLFCAPDAYCRALAREGGSCEGGLRCSDELSCQGAEGERVCRAVPGEVGAPCDPEGAGCGASLETGLACVDEGAGPRCVEARVVDEGEACDSSPGEVDAALWCLDALSSSYCDVVDDTCLPRPGPGEPCDEQIPCDTERGLCREGVCLAWPAEGEPCLIDGGLSRCGPRQLCDEGHPSGPRCVSEAPPLRLPTCSSL